MSEAKPALPRVVIDVRMVGPVPHGIAVYTRRIAEGLQWVSEESPLLYEPVFLTSPQTPKDSFFSFGTVTISAEFLNPAELVQVPRVLSKLKAKAFHSPSFCSFVRLPCPWAITLHDLIHLSWGTLKNQVYYRTLVKSFSKGAAAVITVSEFSRGEISRWLGIPERKIELAPNAISPGFIEAVDERTRLGVLERYGLEKGRYFLCISNPKPHKNVTMLVSAYEALREKAGDALWPLATTVKGHEGKAGVKFLHEVKELETRALMQSAGAVVFPSLYEGFGLPPVEAVCSGAPLLVSRIPPHVEGLHEVGDDEVLWLDPRAMGAWSDGLARAWKGDVPRASETSRKNTAERYNVFQLGQKMDLIYRRMLGLQA